MSTSIINVLSAVMSGMNRFSLDWKLSDLKPERDVTVFSTFSCGGGSTMGYKRAGFRVLGNVEIDPKINAMYVKNNHPRYNFCEDLREFNKREDLPEELYHLDILDGSPPCTSFSSVGVRERDWGKEKTFKEGQTKQTLDDLFFVFLDTVEKLRPKIVIAENVPGLLTGKAKGHVNLIVKRFRELGYDVQMFKLNAGLMDVPQTRHRIFFVANRIGRPKLNLNFHYDPIYFKQVRTESGKSVGDSKLAEIMDLAKPNEKTFEKVCQRLLGETGHYFSHIIINDERVCPAVTSGGEYYRYYDKQLLSDEDFRRVQSFPEDYDFCGNPVQYVTGMSVPPNMMANIAEEIYTQWLK